MWHCDAVCFPLFPQNAVHYIQGLEGPRVSKKNAQWRRQVEIYWSVVWLVKARKARWTKQQEMWVGSEVWEPQKSCTRRTVKALYTGQYPTWGQVSHYCTPPSSALLPLTCSNLITLAAPVEVTSCTYTQSLPSKINLPWTFSGPLTN